MKFNPIEIADAWIAKATSKPDSARALLAKERLKICETCDEKQAKTVAGRGEYFVCGKCGCPLAGKSFSAQENACPLHKWTCDLDYFKEKREVAVKKKALI